MHFFDSRRGPKTSTAHRLIRMMTTMMHNGLELCMKEVVIDTYVLAVSCQNVGRHEIGCVSASLYVRSTA